MNLWSEEWMRCRVIYTSPPLRFGKEVGEKWLQPLRKYFISAGTRETAKRSKMADIPDPLWTHAFIWQRVTVGQMWVAKCAKWVCWPTLWFYFENQITLIGISGAATTNGQRFPTQIISGCFNSPSKFCDSVSSQTLFILDGEWMASGSGRSGESERPADKLWQITMPDCIIMCTCACRCRKAKQKSPLLLFAANTAIAESKLLMCIIWEISSSSS